MRILVVSTCYPFPPRNGVTIPVANYINFLIEQGCIIDLMVIGEEVEVKGAKNIFKNIFFVPSTRNKLLALSKEFLMISPYCSNYSLHPNGWKALYLTTPYDLVLCSPFSVLNVGLMVRDYIVSELGGHPKVVAAVSDCFTAELYYQGRNIHEESFYSFQRVKLLKYRLRSFLMKKMESSLLDQADVILVQSMRDKVWLRKISGRKLSAKVEVVTNGVNDELFSIELFLNRPAINFCFVADLNSQYYLEKFLWLYLNVWTKLDYPDKKLFVYSRKLINCDLELKQILNDPTIIYKDKFLQNISDIYVNIDVAFAPIFKSYGFINKVGEAMAAGVAVIGDKTAFNAIDGFLPDVHGVVANNAKEMLDAVKKISDNSDFFDSIKSNARLLALKSLRWSEKDKTLGGVFFKDKS